MKCSSRAIFLTMRASISGWMPETRRFSVRHNRYWVQAYSFDVQLVRRLRVREDLVVQKIRGVMFEENNNNSMGLEFVNLSHRFGYQSPNWPYFEDVKIERIHYMAKSGVLSQRITTSMHNTTHI